MPSAATGDALNDQLGIAVSELGDVDGDAHADVLVGAPGGEYVRILSFRSVLGEVRPTVLKVDIEGGEWLLNWDDLPPQLRAIHLEMHMIPKKAGGRQLAPIIHAKLLNQGFTATKEPNFKVMWGTHPIYHRDV